MFASKHWHHLIIAKPSVSSFQHRISFCLSNDHRLVKCIESFFFPVWIDIVNQKKMRKTQSTATNKTCVSVISIREWHLKYTGNLLDIWDTWYSFCLSHPYNASKTTQSVYIVCMCVCVSTNFFFLFMCLCLSPIWHVLGLLHLPSPQPNDYLSRKCCTVLYNLLLVLCKYDYLQNVLFWFHIMIGPTIFRYVACVGGRGWIKLTSRWDGGA